MDISNHGAKIMTRARLRAGAIVRLQIIPRGTAPHSASERCSGGSIPTGWRSCSPVASIIGSFAPP